MSSPHSAGKSGSELDDLAEPLPGGFSSESSSGESCWEPRPLA